MYIRERGLALYIYASTQGPSSLFCQLGLFSLDIVSYHCSYICVPRLAFRFHVAGDLN